MLWELVVVYGLSTGQPIKHFTEPMATENQCYLTAINSNITVDPNHPGSIFVFCRQKETK